MKRISRAFAFTIAMVVSTSGQTFQSTSATRMSDNEITKQLEALVEKAATEDSFSGAVLVAKDGKAIFERAIGFANNDTKLQNKTTTRFNLGSINKSFTSVAIAQLAQQGKLAYTDTIAKHLPDYPNKGVAEKVTIHQLLTHTSGLGDYLTRDLAAAKTLRDLLPLFVNQPLLFEPGQKQQYSNSGYVVLGLIIEKLSGRSYYDYVKENIFKPAGMTRTDSFERDQKVADLAVGYTSMGPEGPQPGPRRPNTVTLAGKGSSAGGGYSTVEDMLKFANALNANKLLTPEFTEIVFSGGGAQRPPGAGRGGYGFMQNQANGIRVVGNGGGGPGVNAMFRIYFGRGYTVIVLSNYDPPSAERIAGKINEMVTAN
ncbi:MAG TPA: serine hydrolase domain-containing protein [Pyrinomonadaceae bacterium]|nr:serine hydrolase domain-containing protein [Pyrinomonadaceae bacterium]